MAAVFGCAVSLMTSGRLSLRLAAPATLYWSFLPLLEIAGLAAVWPWKRSPISFARAIDLFFVSNTPWSLWFTAFAGVSMVEATKQIYATPTVKQRRLRTRSVYIPLGHGTPSPVGR